jgi:hypothetical protein
LKSKLYCFLFVFSCFVLQTKGQLTISGTVYDSTKIYTIADVNVYSTSGAFTKSDSMGNYHITVNEQDSIFFFFNNKPTPKYPVKSIADYRQFDISLRVQVKDRYKPLKEVIIYSRSYRMDSLENREDFSGIFNYKKPGVHADMVPGSPAVGFDLDQIINMFRFRHNKYMQLFQEQMIEQEHDNYVNYRFNSLLIRRMTGLDGAILEKYKKIYRPTYQFVIRSSILDFYQYILNTAKLFKAREGISEKALMK